MTEMSINKKPVCRYGNKCYRNNQTHLRDYFHPAEPSVKSSHIRTRNSDNSENEILTDPKKGRLLKNKDTEKMQGKGKKLDRKNQSNSGAEKKRSASNNSASKAKKVKKDEHPEKEKLEEETGNKSNCSEDSDDSENDIKSNSWTYIKVSTQPKTTVNESKEASKEETIKSYYLVDMPSDFYSFFKFCESVNQTEPLNIFKPFGLNLVGPYDILAGKDINVNDKDLMLCHWRYYYDPPEFQTILASESGFHMGYWRDAPSAQPVLVASNNSEDCLFKTEGENVFAAVHHYLTEFIKTSNPFVKAQGAKLQSSLSKWAGENEYSLEKITANIKSRQKKINSKTFHEMGIVVPVEKKTKVGYRPLIETNANLKKICKLVMDADSNDEQELLMEKLQPLITFANIANDECDFGNSLELGINLFCMGSDAFHSVVEHLLTNAYNLLNRPEFSKIIKIHLKNRKKNGKCMSVL